MTPDFSLFASLFVDTLDYWWVIIPATLLGVLVGAIPGFSAANTIIILLPLTLAMEPVAGLVFMVSLYTASRLGAGIPAILVNIPGTAGAAATPLDGYPMATSGRAQQALAISFVASVLGGLLTTVVALMLLPWLSQIAYHLHSVEMIVIMLFGISLIATISAEDKIKGLIAGFFGLMIGYIGADRVFEAPRGTFGFLELYDKVPLIPVLVGLFAISEAFVVIERRTILSEQGKINQAKPSWAATLEGVVITLLLLSSPICVSSLEKTVRPSRL
jgi:putative tricarboxylic transport membrane protein